MSNTLALKRRIGSVKNTKQITKAMEMVAASKMRKSIEVAERGRAYRIGAYSLLARLNMVTDINRHPLFAKRDIKTRLYVIISSDKGLAGAYNSNIVRLLAKSALEDKNNNISSKVIIVGKRGSQFVRRFEHVELIAAYSGFGDQPTANDIRPIVNTLTRLYRDKDVDDVQLLFTEHKSNINQVATKYSLLPAKFNAGEVGDQKSLNGVTFEPSIEEVLDGVTQRLLEMQIWQSMVESIASEHSMRMMAMKNASDNAADLIDDLTMAFNTVRQSSITQELAEITSGAEAMK